MSLRPLPAGVYPGGHVVLLDPERYRKHLVEDEECRCSSPELEWTGTPLGAGVEVRWGSAEHRLCLETSQLVRELLPHAHAGIVAEAHYARGHLEEFDAIVRANATARAHLLAIQFSFHNDGQLQEAQHHVRAMLAREAAVAIAKEIQE